jgi:hypothetical protein
MKPNKQKIISSQPTKPGSASKPRVSRTKPGPKSLSNDIPKYPSSKQSEFQLNDIVKNFKSKKSSSPFKMIEFESPGHGNKNSTVINDIKQSYKFVSALSPINPQCLAEEPKEAHARRSLSEVLKDEEVCNNTTDTLKHRPDSFELYYGILPSVYWCKRCKIEVLSKVQMNLPTLSV